MNIYPKLYLYNSAKPENGFKGNDYTDYILAGSSYVDNLDDTLDTANITLVGLSFKKQFPPKTKFILEYWELNAKKPFKTYNLIVKADGVSQPVLSDNTRFDHNLSLIEVGAIAQGRVVDDFSTTYKLKDVSINEKPNYDTDKQVYLKHYEIGISHNITQDRYGYYTIEEKPSVFVTHLWQVLNMGISFNFEQEALNNISQQLLNQGIKENIQLKEQTKKFVLDIPRLDIFSGFGNGGIIKCGDADLKVIVTKEPIFGGQSQSQEYIIGAVTPQNQWIREEYKPNVPFLATDGYVVGNFEMAQQKVFNIFACKVCDFNITNQNRHLEITLEKGFRYRIKIERLTYESGSFELNNDPSINITCNNGGYSKEIFGYKHLEVEDETVGNVSRNKVIKNQYRPSFPYIEFFVNAYPFEESNSYLVKSAPPISAYDLFLKSQVASNQTYEVKGQFVNDYDFPFKVSNKDELLVTPIIESVYNHKNLWEILMEIGKYIHARPFVRFGDNDDFIIDWKYYGRTDQHTDNATHMSVFNSQAIEEYVCAINSYVDNVIQLGGEITEKFVAKSESENYLVYNDNAIFKVEKPILEVLKMELIVKNNAGQDVALDMTDYVYEESIYKLLSLSDNILPNKGIALYYRLGHNTIEGLNYRLPSVNAGEQENDYNIKKIIYKVLNENRARYNLTVPPQHKIMVNDYVFSLTYRTQDSIRSTQLRPDIRKYLLSSNLDITPKHIQFNNQNDIMVDTEAFGTNVYGKLIRTGNTVYENTEWIDNVADLKESGELYIINGEWVYVSKVENTYFNNHIQSKVEYTKDFNRLSQIIGIPSEPRFYEISERSQIRRNVEYRNTLMVSTTVNFPSEYKYQQQFPFMEFIGNYLLNLNGTTKNLYYANTHFSDINDTSYGIDIVKPINKHFMSSTMTLSWDMQDNFSAGDKIIDVTPPTPTPETDTSSYKSLQAVRYPNVYGRADLCRFDFIDNANINELTDVRNLPEFKPKGAFTPVFSTNTFLLAKDNREALSFNYTVALTSDSDRFVISNNIWGADGDLRCGVSFNNEINKMSTGYINENIIDKSFDLSKPDKYIMVTNILPPDFNAKGTALITIDIGKIISEFVTEEEKKKIKSIILYKKVPTPTINPKPNAGQCTMLIARNITGEKKFWNEWQIRGAVDYDFILQDYGFNEKYQNN